MRRFSFFGGKGGTGKTSCAAAYALSLSRRGVRTLVVSTDPAHSLSDAFGKQIGCEAVRLSDSLHGLEIDAAVEAKKYMELIQKKTLDLVSAAIVDEIKRQIEIAYMSPGAEEAAIFDKFVELMESAGTDYDAIVFDTAPTGHTLRLLTLPEILGVWIDQLIEKRKKAMHLMKMASRYDAYLADKIKEDPILETLTARKEKFEVARDFLTDASLTAFFFVMNAERLSILETVRAVELLTKHGISIGGVVINKVIPQDAGAFFDKRRVSQESCLADIRARFSQLKLVELPLLETDVQGLEQLDVMASTLSSLDETKD